MIRISAELTLTDCMVKWLAPARLVRHDAHVTTQRITADQRNSFIAAMLGWTMDAFDYFIVVFVYADIAKTFHHSKAEVAFITTATLAMRPVGALLFGLWADRVGRRTPLMVDVIFYSVVGFLCAFAPNFTVLVILRLLYGLGMGGEWGLAPRSPWKRFPLSDVGFSQGCCRRATRSVICWRAWHHWW